MSEPDDDQQLTSCAPSAGGGGASRARVRRICCDDVLPRLAHSIWPTRSHPAAGGDVASGDVWLEIGFGGGEHLIWQARHNPDVTLIGCEPFEDGVVKVLDADRGRGLDNVRIHMGRCARRCCAGCPERRSTAPSSCFPIPGRSESTASGGWLMHLAGSSGARPEAGRGAAHRHRYRRLCPHDARSVLRREPRSAGGADGPADWRVRPARLAGRPAMSQGRARRPPVLLFRASCRAG